MTAFHYNQQKLQPPLYVTSTLWSETIVETIVCYNNLTLQPLYVFMLPASMRLCMGSRRGFIVRMKIGNTAVDPMTASHTIRIRQRNTLGPSSDGHQYAVVHVTGYVKNWPPAGRQQENR